MELKTWLSVAGSRLDWWFSYSDQWNFRRCHVAFGDSGLKYPLAAFNYWKNSFQRQFGGIFFFFGRNFFSTELVCSQSNNIRNDNSVQNSHIAIYWQSSEKTATCFLCLPLHYESISSHTGVQRKENMHYMLFRLSTFNNVALKKAIPSTLCLTFIHCREIHAFIETLHYISKEKICL